MITFISLLFSTYLFLIENNAEKCDKALHTLRLGRTNNCFNLLRLNGIYCKFVYDHIAQYLAECMEFHGSDLHSIAVWKCGSTMARVKQTSLLFERSQTRSLLFVIFSLFACWAIHLRN